MDRPFLPWEEPAACRAQETEAKGEEAAPPESQSQDAGQGLNPASGSGGWGVGRSAARTGSCAGGEDPHVTPPPQAEP